MPDKQPRLVFINLPVAELKASMSFFAKLGFEFNLKFTNDDAACMIISETSYVMLLCRPFFRTFTKRSISDAHQATEVMVALSCESRDAVETFFQTAIRAGATEAMPAQDLGFMYSRSFYDLDGHHWEPMWMDPKAAESGPEAMGA